MPGMSGWTLAAKLRTEIELDAPIVMVSAHADYARTAPEGVTYHDDFIAKPFNIELLLARLERHLRLEWLTDEPQPRDALLRKTAPAPDLDALEDMLAIGHFRGLTEAIAAIDTSVPERAAFAEDAAQKVEALDFDGLETLVREARNG